MDSKEVNDLITLLGKYDINQIKTALENCQPKEVGESVEPVKKKRGRPKKTQQVQETTKTVTSDNGFIDEAPKTKEEKRIAEASKLLISSKGDISVAKRPAIKMIQVFCKNCHRPTQLPSNFPDLDKFICCI